MRAFMLLYKQNIWFFDVHARVEVRSMSRPFRGRWTRSTSVCALPSLSATLSLSCESCSHVCLSFLWVFMSVNVSFHLSVCLYVCLLVILSVYVSFHLSVCLYVCLLVLLSVCESFYKCSCLSVSLSICLWVFCNCFPQPASLFVNL